jgi:hypothetical protein
MIRIEQDSGEIGSDGGCFFVGSEEDADAVCAQFAQLSVRHGPGICRGMPRVV